MGNAGGILKSPAAAAVVGTAVTVAAGGGAVATATVAVTAASLAAAIAASSESPFSAGSNDTANIEALKFMHAALSMAQKSKGKIEKESSDVKMGKEKGKAAASESDGKGGCKCTVQMSDGRMIGESCKFHLDKKKVTTGQLNFLDLPFYPDGKEKPQESPQMLKHNQDEEKPATAEDSTSRPDTKVVHITNNINRFAGNAINNGSVKSFNKDNQEKQRVGKSFEYPQRPDKRNCNFYIKTGTCKFGSNCRFNHPPKRKKNEAKTKNVPDILQVDKQKGKADTSERDGKRGCKCNAASEGQMVGESCKCHLDKKKVTTVQLNFLDLPFRPGRKECPYYMRTGNCKYALNCMYHHPDPTASNGQDPLSRCQNGRSTQAYDSRPLPPSTPWPMQMTTTEPTFFSDAWAGTHLPSEWLPLNHESSNYQGLDCPVYALFHPEANVQTTVNMNSNKNNTAVKENHLFIYPQRPGRPECRPFLENGTCKYKSACMYHHPRTKVSTQRLPLKTEQTPCLNFKNLGSCKYGSSCFFQHSVCSSSPSTVSAVSRNCQEASNKKS